MLRGSRAAQSRCTRAISGGEIKDGGTQARTLGKQAFASTEKHPWEARLEMRIEKEPELCAGRVPRLGRGERATLCSVISGKVSVSPSLYKEMSMVVVPS